MIKILKSYRLETVLQFVADRWFAIKGHGMAIAGNFQSYFTRVSLARKSLINLYILQGKI